MKVTHGDIAEKAGVARTTVTKVLNRDPNFTTRKEVRDKVFRIAEELGYNVDIVHRPFHRDFDRVTVNAPAEIEIRTDKLGLFGRGIATVKDISGSGALLTDIIFPHQSLPLESFRIQVFINDNGSLQGVTAEGYAVRIAGSDTNGNLEFGIHFTQLEDEHKKRILDLMPVEE